MLEVLEAFSTLFGSVVYSFGSFISFIIEIPAHLTSLFNQFVPFLPDSIIPFVSWALLFVVFSILIKYTLKLLSVVF